MRATRTRPWWTRAAGLWLAAWCLLAGLDLPALHACPMHGAAMHGAAAHGAHALAAVPAHLVADHPAADYHDGPAPADRGPAPSHCGGMLGCAMGLLAERGPAVAAVSLDAPARRAYPERTSRPRATRPAPEPPPPRTQPV